MMRALAERHGGLLPLDTVEGIWRVIIGTFTYVQARYSVHADISGGDAPMRDSARFHFGFTVPYVTARERRRGDRGGGPLGAAISASSALEPGRDERRLVAGSPTAAARRSSRACPSSSGRPSGRHPGLRHLEAARPMRPCATWCSMPPSSSAGTRALKRGPRRSAARSWQRRRHDGLPCSRRAGRVEPARSRLRWPRRRASPSSPRSAAMPTVSASNEPDLR